jgi:hypothetical protein
MSSKIVLFGYGMTVPRLGEPYTLTIQSALVYGGTEEMKGCEVAKQTEEITDDEKGRLRLSELLGRKSVNLNAARLQLRRFTHTFSKVTGLEDTGDRYGDRTTIKIKGISPKIDGHYVEVEIGYPNNYNPPIIT